jgi:hypothetical protein
MSQMGSGSRSGNRRGEGRSDSLQEQKPQHCVTRAPEYLGLTAAFHVDRAKPGRPFNRLRILLRSTNCALEYCPIPIALNPSPGLYLIFHSLSSFHLSPNPPNNSQNSRDPVHAQENTRPHVSPHHIIPFAHIQELVTAHPLV